jgi:hypothetical protein
MNKKKHWWNKIGDWWRSLDNDQKNLLIAGAVGAASGAAGAAVGVAVNNALWQREFDQLTIDASTQAINAYDQGVFDGATNPSLLRNLRDLGRI